MIWQRYLLREILKIFALVLFAFYFLYMAFDYSLHMHDFIKDKRIQIIDFIFYYGNLFVKRADLLVSLAMLVATIKVLCSLNTHRELLALQVAGIPFKKLIRPFMFIAVVCTIFSYFSMEFIFPRSTTYLDAFHNAHFRHRTRLLNKQQVLRREKLHVLSLKDRSKIIYQHFDKNQNAYFDVVWLRTAQDIWRIKYLNLDGPLPLGKYVDHFQSDTQGFFAKTESFESCNLPALKWDPESGSFAPFENRKPSELWRIAHRASTSSYERSEILTNFFFKCAMPLLPILVVIAAAPFCIRYTRTQTLFFIYAFGLFGFITFYLLVNASVILGENRVVAPALAVFAPFLLCALPFIWKYRNTY